jgi:hypothetical protein
LANYIAGFGEFRQALETELARGHCSRKRVTSDQIDLWKRQHSLDLPYFYNDGWQRIAGLTAEEVHNRGEFAVPGAGEYALVVEAPVRDKEGHGPAVRLTCSAPGRLLLPQDFDAARNLTLPLGKGGRRFHFSVAPAGDASAGPLQLNLELQVQEPTPANRVLLECKGAVPSFPTFC